MIDIGIILEHGGRHHELELSIAPDAPASAFYELVAGRIGRSKDAFTLRRGDAGRQVPRGGEVSDLRLVHGELLRVHDGPATQQASESTTVDVTLIDGPHAGDVITVSSFPFEIGRSSKCAVPLERDEAASRRHARISVSTDGLVVDDVGSTNGTFVEDVKIEGSHALRPNQIVTVGDTQMTVVLHEGLDDLAHLRYENGRLLLNRSARTQRRRPDEVLEIPRPPDSNVRRKLPKAAIIGPALMGIPLFLFTRNPLTLVLILGSPLLAIFSWFDDRSSGRKDFRQQSDKFRADIETLAGEVDDANDRSRRWRLERNPPPDEVVARALRHAPELWQRGAGDPDFLELRVGEVDQPSFVAVKVPEGGDDELRQAVIDRIRPRRIDQLAPIVIPIGQAPPSKTSTDRLGESTDLVDVVAVVGNPDRTTPTTRWLLTQLVTHHSPQDVAVAILAPRSPDSWEWARWLPHVEQLSGDDDRELMIARDEADAAQLFASLQTFARNRAEAAKESFSGGVRYRPHVVVVAELPLRVSDSEFTTFLDRLSDANMSVILVAPDRRMVPRAADVVIDITEFDVSVSFVRADVETTDVQLDAVTVDDASRTARALAPLRDTSATSEGTSSIPSRVNLLELLDLVPLTSADVLSRWQDPPKGIRGAIGADVSGVLELELAPHGLVGGTTGAGKSETLQTYVAALALTYPPERLNFIFVDFKGGLAFNQCVNLPHAVGLITNLDPHLAERVMRSLQAELENRTRIINSLGGGDLASLAVKYPDQTPPALVIVFDEFREAVERVPARPGEPGFIDRVMSLARLGRQVGMHVILATQTPEGVVTEDLKNNIDLRIALRVKTTDASRSILGVPDAALVSKRIPGRGFVQIEAGDLREFQSAYVGGISQAPDTATSEAVLHTLRLGRAEERERAALRASAQHAGKTDLQIVLDVTQEAAEARGVPPQRRPWQEELEGLLPLRRVLEATQDPGANDRMVLPVGLSDDPAGQRQDWYSIDLERAGSMLVFGGTGAGKSTLLRSIAVSAALRSGPDDLNIYAVDFTGQSLAHLTSLPHCAAAVQGRETDRLRQLVETLKLRVAQRFEELDAAGAGSIQELNQRGGQRHPLVLLLLDGFFQFYEQYADNSTDPLYDDLVELIESGRPAGLYSVVTASRSAVPPSFANSIPLRLVMRMNTADEYGSLGLRTLADLSNFPPGRAFTSNGIELQIGVLSSAVTGAEVSVSDQIEVLSGIGQRLLTTWNGRRAPEMRSLPPSVPLSSFPPATVGDSSLAIAVDEIAVAPIAIDFSRTGTFAVVGPEQSGKTTALHALANRFAAAWPDSELHLVTGRRSALAEVPNLWTSTAFGVEQVADRLRELSGVFASRVLSDSHLPMMIVIDDAEPFVDGTVRTLLDETHLQWRDANVILAVAMTTFAAGKSYAPWFKFVTSARSGLILMPDLLTDGAIFDRRLPNRARLEALPGRGFLVQRNGYTLVQVAQS